MATFEDMVKSLRSEEKILPKPNIHKLLTLSEGDPSTVRPKKIQNIKVVDPNTAQYRENTNTAAA